MCYSGRHNKHIKMQTEHPGNKNQPSILTKQENLETESRKNTELHFMLKDSHTKVEVLQVWHVKYLGHTGPRWQDIV